MSMSMPRSLTGAALIAAALLAAGCGKKAPPPAPAAEASAPVAATPPAPAPAADPGPQDEKQAKLAYAQMEDGYLNDPHGQWAVTAKASSSFSEDPQHAQAEPEKSKAWNTTGQPDGKTWEQKEQNIGMDWLETGYAKPVHATAVRAVLESREAVEALTKIELIDEAGKAQTIWSGVSDVKWDARGPRTWFVREFPKTETAIKTVRLTFANAVSSGYKHVNAVQLVGE